MLVCSPGAGVSGGGMVMDRLGGFRLCRRLLDTEETLSPFLSADAMVGRGQGGWNGNGEGHECVDWWRDSTRGPGLRTTCRDSVRPNSGVQTVWQRLNLNWVGLGKQVYFCPLFAFQALGGLGNPHLSTCYHWWSLGFRQGPHPGRSRRAKDRAAVNLAASLTLGQGLGEGKKAPG